ncbi:hypothetical protein ACIBJF_34145 [Streptomyces sp. NPDC050743]|uniref:hypothetical protein n=1 Tax=Streptomyces sp. NPDC050743 TaxID=3365634 RepID=UPI0037BDE0DE
MRGRIHQVTSVLVPGGLPALYDGAEVLLERVSGTLADRIGARPVLLGRELGDASGPLAVAAAASLATLTYGCGALAVLIGTGAVVAFVHRRPVPAPPQSETDS